MTSPAQPGSSDACRIAGAGLALAIAVILGALAFEHIGGYVPCPLCLMQRYAYYAGIPLLAIALVLLRGRPQFAAFLLGAVALGFLANAGLGAYHAGVEWKLWPGPDTCSTVQALPTSAADLLKEAQSRPAVRCDEASWRAFGLSFAGWNVVVSLILCAGLLRAAVLARAKREA